MSRDVQLNLSGMHGAKLSDWQRNYNCTEANKDDRMTVSHIIRNINFF